MQCLILQICLDDGQLAQSISVDFLKCFLCLKIIHSVVQYFKEQVYLHGAYMKHYYHQVSFTIVPHMRIFSHSFVFQDISILSFSLSIFFWIVQITHFNISQVPFSKENCCNLLIKRPQYLSCTNTLFEHDFQNLYTNLFFLFFNLDFLNKITF